MFQGFSKVLRGYHGLSFPFVRSVSIRVGHSGSESVIKFLWLRFPALGPFLASGSQLQTFE